MNSWKLITLKIFVIVIISSSLVAIRHHSALKFHDHKKQISPKKAPLDTIPLRDRKGDFITQPNNNVIDLKDPSNIEKKVEYDPVSNQYIITEMIGNDYYRMPTYMTFDEYLKYKDEQQKRDYFNRLAGIGDSKNKREIKDPIKRYDVRKSLIDRLFGGNDITIKPQGNVDLIFGYNYQKIDNPILPQIQKAYGIFDFDMQINMNVSGSIGEKLKLSANYNTQSSFDFENQMKISYDTDNFSEDEIVKKIEAGNVTFPLKSSLIQGSQSLFGFKTDLQFGHLKLSLLASQQKGQQKNITVQGGAQLQQFNVRADEYDENRNFFLTHYFRDHFEESLGTLPINNSKVSIRTSTLEVWVTPPPNDIRSTSQNGNPPTYRDILALSDLGEHDTLSKIGLPVNNLGENIDITGLSYLPSNNGNKLFQLLDTNQIVNRELDKILNYVTGPEFQLENTRDFVKQRMRKLEPTEYYLNETLGYISLNSPLKQNEALAVSFEYDYNGRTFRVGEFTKDFPQFNPAANTTNSTVSTRPKVLFTKLIKSTSPNINTTLWDLMMKNIYAIGAFQVNPQDFRLDIFYEDREKKLETRFLPTSNLANKPLIRIFNLDNMNQVNDPVPDGIFDFVPGMTINQRNGRIMFPVLEPFGSSLSKKITDPAEKKKYVYQDLYDNTITLAREKAEKNRFLIKGQFKTSVSTDIPLGAFSVPQGSVRVTAGGNLLIEGRDYEVDYSLGRIRLLNDGYLASGIPINVSFEDNAVFNFNQKTMFGVRADYAINKNFNVGGTFLTLRERPYTFKVNIGEDPINNKVVGLDLNFTKELPWLTKALDKLPLYSTKEISKISFAAEGAALIPGHSKNININGEKEGSVFIDDFEGSVSNYDLKAQTNTWALASLPSGMKDENGIPIFPESRITNSLNYGVNRARLAWYRVEPSIRTTANGAERNAYTRTVNQTEIFVNKSNPNPAFSSNLATFDISYFPRKRGPYNFDLPFGTPYSKGVDVDGALKNPETRWAGMMRSLPINDFEASNIEYIEFWMLDPFLAKPDSTQLISESGKIRLQLGIISEDILKDSRLFYEHGLPEKISDKVNLDATAWAIIPNIIPPVNAFSNDRTARENQDVGFDGLNDGEEFNFYSTFISTSESQGLSPNVINDIKADPANDNFVHFRNAAVSSNSINITDKYEKFNNPQGNSAISTNNLQDNASTSYPDTEDINGDNTLNESDSYFEYEIPVKRVSVPGGYRLDYQNNPYITDLVEVPKNNIKENWYRFKIPIKEYTGKNGSISDFRAVQYLRMLFTDFTEQTTFRFIKFDLVRNQWRRYLDTLDSRAGAPIFPGPPTPIIMDVNAVNIEENSSKVPFKYVLPPGITRERLVGAYSDFQQNEQSLGINICNLQKGQQTGVYKFSNTDIRLFERLRMYVHAESQPVNTLQDGAYALFFRVGSDIKENYYEYEIPLTFSKNPLASIQDYAQEVWKAENEMDLELSLFTKLKEERNNTNQPYNILYAINDPRENKTNNKIGVKGNPNLGNIRTFFIGVRNINQDNFDAGCVEVWVNELRASGFDERGGYAATARMNVNLADLGDFKASTNYASIGWGGIDQKLQQRSREEVLQYDLSTTLELGKFLPEKSGIKIPVYAQYSSTIKTPQYDPYDLDLELKSKLRSIQDPVKRDSVKEQAIDFTSFKTVNFTNVRKERTNSQAKPMPWNVENFNVNYSYTETNKHDPIIAQNKLEQHKGGIDYNYSRSATYISPFKKIIKKDKYLKLLSDFHFNLWPNSFRMSNVLDRQYGERYYRFTVPSESKWVDKRFTWDRQYALDWDITRSLKFNFTANNQSIIDELPEIDRISGDRFNYEKSLKDQTIKENLLSAGRNKDYRHSIGINYSLPFKNIPFMDWINVKASGTATYQWSSNSQLAWENTTSKIIDSLGNVIQNNQVRQIGGDFNFDRLYAKSKYLASLERPRTPSNSALSKKQKALEEKNNVRRSDPNNSNDADGPKLGGGADAKSSKNKSAKTKGGIGGAELPPSSPSSSGQVSADDGTSNGTDTIAKKAKGPHIPGTLERILIRPLLSLRKAKFNYSETYGSIVPGFKPRTKLFGLSDDWQAPGYQYILGFQPSDREIDAYGEKGWITDNVNLNQRLSRTFTQTMDARITLEPFADFKIDLDVTRNYTKNNMEMYKDTLPAHIASRSNQYFHTSKTENGSYTISFMAIKTLFKDDSSSLEKLFRTFEANRAIISQRIGTGTHDKDPGYTKGYGPNQNSVLIPAFITAYTGKDPNSINSDWSVFKLLPKINWTLNYGGLTKIPFFQKYFTSFSVAHSYKSTLSVNSFTNNSQYNENNPYLLNTATFNYFSRIDIPAIVINENFSPLISLKMKTRSNFNLELEMKKSRTLAISFTDYQLNETKGTEYQATVGYDIKNVKNPFYKRKKGKKKAPTSAKKNIATAAASGGSGPVQGLRQLSEKGDLKVRLDMSYRNDITQIHMFDQQTQALPTRGMKLLKISPSVEYDLSPNLSMRLFVDYSNSRPATSIANPIVTFNGGMRIRYSFN